MSAFDLLSEPVRKYIWRQRWDELRPIQSAAIQKILSTDLNYILAARTASGKTEAAFLPIISQYNQSERGIQVLYISPLIALINDQFERIEALCKDLEIRTTKWHGEIERTAKDSLIKAPEGILLITPESIESLFVNRPYALGALFNNLKFVVVDELHTFLSSDRGLHLRSLLSRLMGYCPKVRLIGLSATLGDPLVAKRYLSTDSETRVLNDPTPIDAEVSAEYIESSTPALSQTVIERIAQLVRGQRTLVFPNSRGRVEEIAVRLKKLYKASTTNQAVFAHHSSIDKEGREFAEDFAKRSTGKPFTIVCTSTLELGIDIGQLDSIVQVDSTHSVSSLAQRLGRSGRRGQRARLHAIATNPWALLETLSCVNLYKAGTSEAIQPRVKGFNVAAHQILSILTQVNGCSRDILLKRLSAVRAFDDISLEEHIELIEYMIEGLFVETSDRELILGTEGERLKQSKEFYGLFKTEKGFTVHDGHKRIGDIPDSHQVQVGENLFLAAKIWKIVEVDRRSQKVLVAPAADGKKPVFFGSGVEVSSAVRQRMSDLLTIELSEISDWKVHLFEPLLCVDADSRTRVIQDKGKESHFYAFTGTRIQRTIELILRELSGSKITLFDSEVRIEAEMPAPTFKTFLERIASSEDVTSLLPNLDETVLDERYTYLWPKFFEMVPDGLRAIWLQSNAFDFDGAKTFLRSIRTVVRQ